MVRIIGGFSFRDLSNLINSFGICRCIPCMCLGNYLASCFKKQVAKVEPGFPRRLGEGDWRGVNPRPIC